MQRVVSLLASGTEIACALGAGDRLVGRSHECDYPPAIASLPVLTAPKFPLDGTSCDIDQRVRALLQEGLSLYRVDGDRLRELAPDLIISQTQCDVCAVGPGELAEACGDWLGRNAGVVNLTPFTLDDVWGDIRRVAAALGLAQRGETLVAELRNRLASLEKATAPLARPRVAFVEWVEPLFIGGNWMPELIGIAGGESLLGTPGRHSVARPASALIEANPGAIVVAPCGFDLARTREEYPALTRLPGWDDLPAVRSRRVWIADGNAFFNRSGPRLVDSAEMLSEMLHPEKFKFGHEGKNFIRMAP